MVGEKYFKDCLSNIYHLSPITYKNGIGILEQSNEKIDVTWEFIATICGDSILVLTSNIPFDSYTWMDNSCKLIGTSTCGNWNIEINNIQIINFSQNVKNETFSILMNCLSKEIILKSKNYSSTNITSIEGLISNFKFLGNKISKYGSELRRDLISINFKNRIVKLKLIENYKEVDEKIKIKRIDRAIFSTVNIPILGGEQIEDVINYLYDISNLISFININSNFCNIVNYYSNNEVHAIYIMNKVTSPYHGNIIIDNLHVKNGIVNIIEKGFNNYKKTDTEMNLKIFISMLSGMYEGKYLENKIANLILAYEYLLTKFLISNNEPNVDDMNVQNKLCKTNKYLKFINSKYLEDSFRNNYRNPLFHTGMLPFISHKEAVEFFNEYFDLLIRISLRIIGYFGDYISRIDYTVKKV